MKLRKIFWGFAFLCAVCYPIRVPASGTLSGIGLLAGEEEKNELNIYQVTLPTDGDFELILDPEGLLSIAKLGEYDSSWAGMVHMADGKGALFINRSSFPVAVNVGISIEQDKEGTPSTIELLDDVSHIDESVWPQMYLTVIPGADKIQTMEEFVSSDFKIPVLANGSAELTRFSFLMDKADYIWDDTADRYVLAESEDNYDSASFILSGRVCKNADWSAYVGRVREHFFVHVVYTIQKQDFFDRNCLYEDSEGFKAPYALVKEDYGNAVN